MRDPIDVGGGDTDGDEGTFVWADSTDADFESTGPDQFLIRASGGVGIGTTTPSEQLEVVGNVKAAGTITSGSSIIIDGTAGAETITSTDALELHTSSGRILRLEPEVDAAGPLGNSPNIIAGYAGNNVKPSVTGGTISGGGTDDDGSGNPGSNEVRGDFGTVGGGHSNFAGLSSTVGGGGSNTAGADFSTVGGGRVNQASADFSTVGGGQFNFATADSSTVGGGFGNSTRGFFSTVPGGGNNSAGGDYSFAAGRGAEVRDSIDVGGGDTDGDEGTFVWADSTAADFESTGPDQFLIRASGGVGIGTNSPDFGLLEVQQAGDAADQGIAITNTNNKSMRLWVDGSDVRRIDAGSTGSSNLALNASGGGRVGIGTTSPDGTLHVSRDFNPNISFENSGATGSFRRVSVNFVHDAGTGAEIGAQREGSDADGMYLAFSTEAVGGSLAERMRITPDGNVGIGISNPGSILSVRSVSPVSIPLTVEGFLDGGILVSFRRNSSFIGSITSIGNVVSYNAFTGSHHAWSEESIKPGTLVTLTGDNRWATAADTGEPIYGIAPSSQPNDSRCLGAYFSAGDPASSADDKHPDLVAAVGNGTMWIVETGRDIRPGDYLVSSDVRGHAMLDDASRFDVGYIVARAAESVDWSKVDAAIDGRKHKKLSVFFESFERSGASAAEIASLKKKNAELEARLARIESMLSTAKDEPRILAASIEGVR